MVVLYPFPFAFDLDLSLRQSQEICPGDLPRFRYYLDGLQGDGY
jgi:hypothetical protein